MLDEPVQIGQASVRLRTEDLGPTKGIFTQALSPEGQVIFSRTTPYGDAFFQRMSASPTERVRLHHLAIKRAFSMGRIQLPTRQPA